MAPEGTRIIVAQRIDPGREFEGKDVSRWARSLSVAYRLGGACHRRPPELGGFFWCLRLADKDRPALGIHADEVWSPMPSHITADATSVDKPRTSNVVGMSLV